MAMKKYIRKREIKEQNCLLHERADKNAWLIVDKMAKVKTAV